jgi:hypothetical protein
MEPWEAVILVEKELERIEQNEMLPLELAQRFIADSPSNNRKRRPNRSAYRPKPLADSVLLLSVLF